MAWSTSAIKRAIEVAALLLLTGSVAGCTTVSVANSRSSFGFGVLKVVSDDKAAASVVIIRGVGLVPGSDGATLGYRREVVVSVRDVGDCRIFILTDRTTDYAALAKLLSDAQSKGEQLCVFDTNGTRLPAPSP